MLESSFAPVPFAELPASEGRLPRAALPDQLYRLLKRRVLTCALEPGAPFAERALGEELGVSRTPLREALARLSYEGLVVRQPYRGYAVAPLSPSAYRELSELRAIVEPEVAALAATRAGAADLDELRRLSRATRVRPRSFHEAARRNSQYHLALTKLARNERLGTLVMDAHDHQLRVMYDAWRRGVLADADAPLHDEHEEIVDAVTHGDAETARALMARHVTAHARRMRLVLANGKRRA